MERAERLRFESVRQLGLIDDLDASPVRVQPDCPVMAAAYLHDCDFQFGESPAGESLPPKRSARLFSGRTTLDGTAGDEGRAVSSFIRRLRHPQG